MAYTEITTGNFIDLKNDSEASTGIVMADVTYTTMTSGTGNGVEFSFPDCEQVLIYNDTGGAATFTFLVPEPTKYGELGITFNDKTFSVDNGDFLLVHPDSRYQNTSQQIQVDCSVAGKIAVVKRYTIT